MAKNKVWQNLGSLYWLMKQSLYNWVVVFHPLYKTKKTRVHEKTAQAGNSAFVHVTRFGMVFW